MNDAIIDPSSALVKGRVPWNKGKKRPPFSAIWRKRLGDRKRGRPSGMLGKKHSLATRQRIGRTVRRPEQVVLQIAGHIRWRIRKTEREGLDYRRLVCPWCKRVFTVHPKLKDRRVHCSYSCNSKARLTKLPFSYCVNCDVLLAKKGGKHCNPCKGLFYRGPRASAWKGGLTGVNKLARMSAAYAAWRSQVFERDDYTCVDCGARGMDIQADHILPFSVFEDLRLELSNGVTRCEPCHRATPSYQNGVKRLRLLFLAMKRYRLLARRSFQPEPTD